jgi:hypothetical protein
MTDYVNLIGSLYAYLVFFLINPAMYLLIYLVFFSDSLHFG